MDRREMRNRKRGARLNWRYYRAAMRRSNRLFRQNYDSLARLEISAAANYEQLARKFEAEIRGAQKS